MGDEELEALWRNVISREEAKAILSEALMCEAENLVEEVRKDSSRQLTKLLKSQNEQLRKLIGK